MLYKDLPNSFLCIPLYVSFGELGDGSLAFAGEMPAGASLFKKSVLAELGEVVADGGFISIGEQVLNGVCGGDGAQ